MKYNSKLQKLIKQDPPHSYTFQLSLIAVYANICFEILHQHETIIKWTIIYSPQPFTPNQISVYSNVKKTTVILKSLMPSCIKTIPSELVVPPRGQQMTYQMRKLSILADGLQSQRLIKGISESHVVN